MRAKPTPFPPEFGQKVRYNRVLQGLTLEELGNGLGMHKMVVSQMERGVSSPPALPMIKEMAKLLKIPEVDSQKFVELGVKCRMSGPRGAHPRRRRKGWQTVRVIGGRVQKPTDPVLSVTAKSNPHQVWDDPNAALLQAIQEILEEGGEIGRARLSVENISTKPMRVWEFDLCVSEDLKQRSLEGIQQRRENRKKRKLEVFTLKKR